MMCEKCWCDAYIRMMTRGGSQAEHYAELLRERADNPCALAQQGQPEEPSNVG